MECSIGQTPLDNGPLAKVHIPISRHDKDLFLTAQLRAFVRENLKPEQRIIVSVNDQPQDEWIANKRTPEKFLALISAGDMTGKELQLDFQLPDAQSPKSLGTGGDERLLGAAVFSLKLEIAHSIYDPLNYEQIPFYGRCRGCEQ